jgi:hypothetical protein
MLFQELVHSDAVGFPSELQCPSWINLVFVMEYDKVKREGRLTGGAHRLDIFLKPL